MYLEGTDVVNELKENIRISREQFDAIIAMYKKTLAGSSKRRTLRQRIFRPSLLGARNDTS
ncbi:hypothetical protein CLIM01_15247 [Colletotrichum limetticola]|uniref:Uncharacterized protein n=1 Tax=Colletotrichum limetticola TaxID=1209924 RepID=A0ABQ9PAH3_9PEZI|nr:hypothetical protein CLIM01_15247 [Colletotrichum limetticola]